MTEARPSEPHALVVWCFTDAKPGHENQSRGLLQALAERHELQVHWLAVGNRASALLNALLGRWPDATGLPDPQLIVGAGHATHLPMLAARRARGGRTILLMKPSLPLSLFDLCIIPEHDRPRPARNVLVSRGVLNTVRPGDKAAGLGLLLMGGPSAHFHWSDQGVIRQIHALLEANPQRHWQLTTSRRTPASFSRVLRRELAAELAVGRLDFVPVEDTARDWLPARLAAATEVWVSEDSVSMVYEALTAGAGVGVFNLPRRRLGRVTRGLATLESRGLVARYDHWPHGRPLSLPTEPFNEAERCARWISESWLNVA